jgi:hypothetical protein
MPPRVNRPDQSPDPDGGFDLSTSFGVLITGVEALKTAIENQTTTLRNELDAQLRLAMAGPGRQQAEGHVAGVMSQYAPRMRENVLRSLTMTGGAPADMTAGITRMTGVGALTSLQNLRAYGAQRLGEMIAGVPLYESQPGHGTTPAGSRGGMTSGGTVPGAGAPSPPQPAGSGAPAAAPMPPPAGGAGGAGTAAGAAAASASASGPGGGPPSGYQGLAPFLASGGGKHAAATPSGMTAIAQNIGARVAMTGGTGQGIVNAVKQIPGVGLIADAISGGANFYLSQREAGRTYQEAEGGTNLAAQAERYHSLAYQLSMFGRMPEGAAAEAFGEVTALGYNRMAVNQANQLQNRQSALDFIYHNYTSTGTDVQQSVQILQTVSQSAAISLKSVSSAIDDLSNAAGKAGTNAENARDNFNDLLNAAIQAGAGAAAPQLAGGVAATQASYGNAFAGTNFSGVFSPTEQYLLAGQTGMSPNQIQYTMYNNPSAYNQLVGASALQFIKQFMDAASPSLYPALQQVVQQSGGSQLVNQPALAQQAGLRWWNMFYNQYPQINTNVMAAQFSQLSNIPLTPNNVLQWLVEQVAGNGIGGTAGAGAGSLGGASSVSASAAAAGTSGAATGQYGLATGAPSPYAQGGRSSALAGPGQTWQQQLLGDNKAAAQQYLAQEGKSGQRSPVLEALLQNVPANTQVAVKTASGIRVMSFAQAMQYYPNEMAAGDVEFYNSQGQALGGTQSFTQGLVNASAPVGPEESGKAGAAAGMSWSQYSKKYGIRNAPQLDLTDDAKKLVKLLSPGDKAAASATVPAPPYVASPSR